MSLAPPNAELVHQAWLAAYAGIPAASIATSLPKTRDGQARTWTTFLTVRALPAGNPNIELSERRSTITQLDGWAASPHSPRPPWGAAITLLEKVRLATFRDAQPYGRPIEMPVSGYLPARIFAAMLTTEPSRVEGDPSGFAHVTCDLAVDWTV